MARSCASGSVSDGDAPTPGRDRVLHRLLEDRDEQVVLAAEVQVDGAGGDPGGSCDVRNLSIEEAACGEGFDRRAQQGVALVDLLGAGAGGRRRLAAMGMNECSFIARGVVNHPL